MVFIEGEKAKELLFEYIESDFVINIFKL